jgi:hypothetical protein
LDDRTVDTGPVVKLALSLIRLVVLAITAVTLMATPSHAADEKDEEKVCYEIADAYSVVVVCEHTGASLSAARAAEPDAKWVVYQLCKDGTSGGVEACSNPRVCRVGDVSGTFYVIFKDGKREGLACLTASEARDVDKPPIRVLVISTFEDLDWSPSELTVQPPGGKTLVNLDTNFFTTNTEVTPINVTLQGQTVVVSARPIAYKWTFGDGTSNTTTSPGAPYPDLDVAHVYEQTGTAKVSVDTQYGDASFTVNGGAPEAIPSTVWVQGAAQDLEIVEAIPQLVLE